MKVKIVMLLILVIILTACVVAQMPSDKGRLNVTIKSEEKDV